MPIDPVQALVRLRVLLFQAGAGVAVLVLGLLSVLLRSHLPSAFGDASGTILYGAFMTILVAGLATAIGRIPRHQVTIPLIALALCWAIELFQITPAPKAMATAFWPLHLVFGSTFAWFDMAFYPVGVLLGWGLSALALRLSRRVLAFDMAQVRRAHGRLREAHGERR